MSGIYFGELTATILVLISTFGLLFFFWWAWLVIVEHKRMEFVDVKK